MNVFGGRGVRGKKGARGDSGINTMATFFPITLVKNLQKHDENCCFAITSSTDLVTKDHIITTWLSRSGRGDLKMEKPVEKVEVADHRFSLSFKKGRFTNDDLYFLPNTPGSFGFICITFKIKSAGVLISSYQNPSVSFREIMGRPDSLTITLDDQNEIIQHSFDKWTTLWLSYHANVETTLWEYSINNDTRLCGSFTSPSISETHSALSMGSRFNDNFFFDGEVASFETYHVESTEYFPNSIKKIIISQQLVE